MAASVSDKFSKTFNSVNPNVARVNASRAAGVTTLACDNLAGWPTDTVVHFSTYQVDTGGDVVAGTQIDWKGIVSGNNIGTLTRVAGATDSGSSINDVVEANPTGNWANDLVGGILVQHKQDGSHGAVTADSLTTTGNVTIGGTLTIGGSGSGGWDAASGTVSAVTYNGNRSYDLTISNDNTALISPGMRLRTTRTVAAPTQCATFDGVNDYFSKSSPAGMTFTDDFTTFGWVKLASYGTEGVIISKWDGSNGWRLGVSTSGQVFSQGVGGACNETNTSYQSLPLNKWVHVASTMDLSGNAGNIYLDGVLVPSVYATPSPGTVLSQGTGPLQVGAFNGGAPFFSGKLAQVGVATGLMSQANVRLLMTQGITPAIITSHSIISAYSLSNSLNDLNTTNANNLTANGGAVATNADSPFGGQAGGTISSTLDYGIVAKVTASTITVNVAEGCTIPTSGGVSAVSYSTYKSPYGFPGQKAKWQILFNSRTSPSQSGAVISTWYNIGSGQLSVPIGAWNLDYQALVIMTSAGGVADVQATLSTANNSNTDLDMVSNAYVSSTSQMSQSFYKAKAYDLSATTTYYLNTQFTTAVATVVLYNYGTISATVIRAENAYL